MAELLAPLRATGHCTQSAGTESTGLARHHQARETAPAVGTWLHGNKRITLSPTIAATLAESDHDDDSDASSNSALPRLNVMKPAGHFLDVSIDKSPVYDGPADLPDRLEAPARTSNYSSVASFDSVQYQHRVSAACKSASLDLTWLQRESEQPAPPLFAEIGVEGTTYQDRKRKHASGHDPDEVSRSKSADNLERVPRLLGSAGKHVATEHQIGRQMAYSPWGCAKKPTRKLVSAHCRGWQRRSPNGSIGKTRFNMATSTPTNVQSTPRVFPKHRPAGHGSAPPKVTFARSPKFYIPDDGASQSVCSVQDALCDDNDGNLAKFQPGRGEEANRNRLFLLLWLNVKRPVASIQNLDGGGSGRELSLIVGWTIMPKGSPHCNGRQLAAPESEDEYHMSLALSWIVVRAVARGGALLQRVLGQRFLSRVHALWRSLLWAGMAFFVWLLGKFHIPLCVKVAGTGVSLPKSA